MEELRERATSLAEAGDYAAAATLFGQAAREWPRVELLEPLAQCLLELGDAAGAARAARSALQILPECSYAWLTLGRSCLNGGEYADAVAAFRQAVSLDPGLEVEVAEDHAVAVDLVRQQDERMLLVGGAEIKLQQWREVDASLFSCPHTQTASLTPSACCSNAASKEVEASGIESRGTGTMIWECGVILAMAMDYGRLPIPQLGSPPASWRGLRVLELGSGTGVAGLAAAALGELSATR